MFGLLWFALAIVSAFYGFATAIAQDVQNLDAFQSRPTANGVIYAGDSHTVLAILRSPNENRKLVQSDQIAKVMKQAIVAIEDKRFYEHGAIDPIGLARAAAVDLLTGRTQGGSTITQQFVKNVYTKGQRTLQRKLVEAVLAAQVEKSWSKDHILTEYLNTVYFGNHAYGVEEAAQIYFGTHARSLLPWQAALLAGIVRAPTDYDPVRHPKAALARRNEVLANMLQQKMLKPVDYALDIEKPLLPFGHKVRLPAATRGVAAYFTQYVERELIARFGRARTFGGGLKVYTTIDLAMQKKARHTLNTTLKRTGPAGALVAIDPHTGQVKALVGGRDFSRQPFDVATQARRQPGSAFKPFVLAAALERGIQPSTTFQSRPQVIPLGGTDYWVVRNDTPQYNGTIPISTATTLSDNTVYAQLTMRVGPEAVRTEAHAMGITSPLDALPSIGLGALRLGVSPLEMAHAYATLANGGARIGGSVAFRTPEPGEQYDPSADPISITKVIAPNGKVIANNAPVTRQVVSRETALEIDSILQSVIRYGTAKTIKGFPRPAFGKTGTTSNFVDAWFAGATPQLATAVWVGYVNHAIPMLKQYKGTPVFGGTIPAIIWSLFEQRALAGQPVPLVRPAVAAGSRGRADRYGERASRDPIVSPRAHGGAGARQGAGRLLALQRDDRPDARPHRHVPEERETPDRPQRARAAPLDDRHRRRREARTRGRAGARRIPAGRGRPDRARLRRAEGAARDGPEGDRQERGAGAVGPVRDGPATDRHAQPRDGKGRRRRRCRARARWPTHRAGRTSRSRSWPAGPRSR